ncbi:hypothetical protein ppKF707_3446 [Metapseudomonas furukawaii]|nr:hypothetical protein ppKF707_3446 [Pseudomonas furukawaii]
MVGHGGRLLSGQGFAATQRKTIHFVFDFVSHHSDSRKRDPAPHTTNDTGHLSHTRNSRNSAVNRGLRIMEPCLCNSYPNRSTGHIRHTILLFSCCSVSLYGYTPAKVEPRTSPPRHRKGLALPHP